MKHFQVEEYISFSTVLNNVQVDYCWLARLNMSHPQGLVTTTQTRVWIGCSSDNDTLICFDALKADKWFSGYDNRLIFHPAECPLNKDTLSYICASKMVGYHKQPAALSSFPVPPPPGERTYRLLLLQMKNRTGTR